MSFFGYDHGEDDLIERERTRGWWKPIVIYAIVGAAVLFLASLARAEGIAEHHAVRAILGEARGEGYNGMLAVAHAIRNRGHLRGVYGATADMEEISAQVYHNAVRAWYESESTPDPTHGANCWENTDDFGVPWWAEGKRPTAIIGRHRFFKLERC